MPFLFKRLFLFVAIFVLVFSCLPGKQVHASFWGSLVRLLGGGEADASDIEMQTPAAAAVAMPLLGSSRPTPAGQFSGSSQDAAPLSAVQDSAFVASRNPAGTLPSTVTDTITVYTVLAGDTASSIAERFGITLDTLLWANNLRNAGMIHEGDQLVILPVSGVRYEVKKGDTVESIARQFKADTDDILGFNDLAIGESLQTGITIIIPQGTPTAPTAPSVPASSIRSRFALLPEFIGYYLRPILGGRNSRATASNPHGLHGFNGVDLATAWGSSIYAAADGTVLIARSSGWNSGYGKYVVVAHPNGTQTLYGHMSSVLVQPGERVAQGETIGLIGSTGNSTGPHVHFEIRGAKNPF